MPLKIGVSKNFDKIFLKYLPGSLVLCTDATCKPAALLYLSSLTGIFKGCDLDLKQLCCCLESSE